eukprot:CAMPEP_0181210446 /NCGR_PEP_ID=MMETSP1096-20121128/23232_1 /TAXON_ID=156174 ORGANISM="Chrysochromulina ericina, Strain CCMP281" /NCGR_SAMPLE_ID=MMETSP1096 /ASSEMBLY_ACC=CAM_ASM_000453 /LENGTH=139 /DNA_ID=CAMNT_0023301731 /DNA_START=200 /DNA_END=618 /DNA_ORIENTATION=-
MTSHPVQGHQTGVTLSLVTSNRVLISAWVQATWGSSGGENSKSPKDWGENSPESLIDSSLLVWRPILNKRRWNGLLSSHATMHVVSSFTPFAWPLLLTTCSAASIGDLERRTTDATFLGESESQTPSEATISAQARAVP